MSLTSLKIINVNALYCLDLCFGVPQILFAMKEVQEDFTGDWYEFIGVVVQNSVKNLCLASRKTNVVYFVPVFDSLINSITLLGCKMDFKLQTGAEVCVL